MCEVSASAITRTVDIESSDGSVISIVAKHIASVMVEKIGGTGRVCVTYIGGNYEIGVYEYTKAVYIRHKILENAARISGFRY
ncbi:MAG: hypothetical protein WC907_06865 [Acholeplasmataceae bacterium]